MVWTCGVCGENEFSDVEGFLTHRQFHPPSRDKMFCTQPGCFKRLTKEHYFKSHVRKHALKCNSLLSDKLDVNFKIL